MATTTRPAERAPLNAEAIVAGAVALADEAGIKAITMRKLAGHLGYEVMSLYNHVANKPELLGRMVDSVAAEVETPPEDLDPLAAVRAIAESLHTALVAHPWAAGLWISHMPGPERARIMEDLLRLLAASDLTPSMAHHGFHAVSNHVVGYTIQELALAETTTDLELDALAYRDSLDAEVYPHTVLHIDQHLEGDSASSFELVLDLILDGIARLSAEERAATGGADRPDGTDSTDDT
jgi:AcrR family transcriptional regulator